MWYERISLFLQMCKRVPELLNLSTLRWAAHRGETEWERYKCDQLGRLGPYKGRDLFLNKLRMNACIWSDLASIRRGTDAGTEAEERPSVAR